MSQNLAHMCTRMSLHVPCSRRERRSWKAVHLSTYIRGGAQAEQCVLSFTEEIAETFFSLSAKKGCVHLCLHACLSKVAALVRGGWTVQNEVVCFRMVPIFFLCV